MNTKTSYLSNITVTQLMDMGKSYPMGGRYCLHERCNKDIQLMIINFPAGKYYPKHRHLKSDEYYILLSGKLRLTLYHDDLESRSQKEEVILSAVEPDTLQTFKMPKGVWHSVSADILSGAVFIEAKGGAWHPSDTEIRG